MFTRKVLESAEWQNDATWYVISVADQFLGRRGRYVDCLKSAARFDDRKTANATLHALQIAGHGRVLTLIERYRDVVIRETQLVETRDDNGVW